MTQMASPRAHPATTLEDSELISRLFRLAGKNKRLVKSTLHKAPADPDIMVRSWKMDEFKYYIVPSPFPTLARGLFTISLKAGTDKEGEASEKDRADEPAEEEGAESIRHRIVIRGYDKFFNIGEVPWTNWSALEAHTTAPYTLSLKSNGCIIFIGALAPSKLLVTSKHSLGNTPNDDELSHAKVGDKWLRKYLADKGKTEEQLASVLWENNWTAVAELCDDSFEEHVLPYPPELTGLHLHGINTSTKAFHTLSPEQVDAFADEWGFIKTLTVTVNSIKEVKEFTDSVAEKQEWRGQAVEGFVVRTHVSSQPTIDGGGSSKVKGEGAAPYDVGSTLFFKVKFDEPYMMYRDWREVTRTLLSHSAKTGPASLSPSMLSAHKMKRKETKVYVRWVIKEIQRDPHQFDEFSKGKGIIRTRERFLEWLANKSEVSDEEADERTDAKAKKYGKTVIVPVAIPGCGKTTVALALSHLFGFGHTQSDDVSAKKPAPIFLKNVVNLLKSKDIVIADKNNHLKQHRSTLRDAVGSDTRLVALYWNTKADDTDPTTIHKICGDRVFARGDNHQTLRVRKDASDHEDIVWQFLFNSEELAPAEVDDIVEMNIAEDVTEAVRRATRGLVKLLDLDQPSEEAIHDAVSLAMGYSVDSKRKRDMPAVKTKKDGSNPRYFGILPEVNLDTILDPLFSSSSDIDPAFYHELKGNNRVTPRPHITVLHSKEKSESTQALWDRCNDIHALSEGPVFDFTLGHVLWDGRVMAITVDDLRLRDSLEQQMQDLSVQSASKGSDFLKSLPEGLRTRLHITVGTKNKNITPVEAKTMVERWRKGDREGVHSVGLEGIHAHGLLKGLMQ